MATTYYKRNTNPTNNNWNQNDNWSTVSSTSSTNAGTYPVAGDTANFDANSINVTINTTSACAVLDCTGYANTITQSANMTTTGNVTLVTSGLSTSGTPTWTFSGGTVIPAGNTFYDININNATVTLSTSDVTVSHNLTLTGSSAILTGRTVTMTGGTWSHTSTGKMRSNLTFNGNCTVSGTVYFGDSGTPTITWSSGTITTNPSSTNSTLTIQGSCTLNTDRANMIWGNININPNSVTLTLSANTECRGNFTTANVNTTLATSDLWVGGNLSIGSGSSGSGSLLGNGRKVTLNGTGTWSMCNSSGSRIDVDIDINTSGTISISGTIRYGNTSGTSVITYTSGTVDSTTHALALKYPTTLNTSGMVWDTLNPNYASNGSLTLTSDCTCNNFTINTSATATLVTSNLYVKGNLTMSGGSGAVTGQTIYMTGEQASATWSASATCYVRSNLIFLGGANTIIVSGNVYYYTGTLTYTSGTITTTGSTLNIVGSCTLNTPRANMTWNNITQSATGTLTLSADTECVGNFVVANGAYCTIATSDLWVGGGMTIGTSASSTTRLLGTRTITLNGTGTFASTSQSGGGIDPNIIFNTAGTISLSGAIKYGVSSSGQTITYTAGTINAGTATITFFVSSNLNTNGMTWYSVNTAASAITLTLQSALQADSITIGNTSVLACGTNDVTLTGNFTNNRSTAGRTGNNTFTFNGTSTIGGTADTNFYNVTFNAGKTITQTSGRTTTVTNTFTANGTKTDKIIFNCSTPGTHGMFYVTGTVGTVDYCTVTDVDSGASPTQKTITTAHGLLSNTHNWVATAGYETSNACLFGADF